MCPVPVCTSSQVIDGVTCHEVLRPSECESLHEKILGLRQVWTRRGESSVFFTLGAASYLDATARDGNYHQMAQRMNLVLQQNFNWLYERLRAGFTGLLNAPVR